MASTQFDAVTANQASGEEAGEGLDFLGFLRRRKSFVILLAGVGIGVGYLLFQRQIPQYQSNSWVQVIHRSSDARLTTMLAEKDLRDADYVIKSPKVLSAAFEKHNLSQFATLRDLTADEAVARMTGMITTKNMSAAVVQVSCNGSNPADIREIANAVAEEYLVLQRENYEDASTELQALLTKARDDVSEQLKTAEDRYSEFRKTSHLTPDGRSPHRSRQDAVDSQISALEIQKTQLRSELRSLEEAMRTGGSREAILMLVGKQTSGSAVDGASSKAINETVNSARTVTEAIFPLMVQEAAMTAELGSDHPKLRALRMQIEMTREYFREMAEGSTGKDNTTASNEPPAPAPPDFLTVYLQSLAQELMIIENKQLGLKELQTREENAARSMLQEENEDRRLQDERIRLAKFFDAIVMQISEIKVNTGMGGVTAQVLAPARHGVLVYPSLSQFLGLGGFLGAFAGLVIGYLVEIADRSFRKPEDIIREFGVPIIGHVPFMNDKRLSSVPRDSGLDRTVVTVHLPRSRPSEAYRSVRTAVCFSAMGGTHKLIQVTSPAAGDGKSTLAINLAVTMAQSGKKTVLVESDFRRPKVHKLTGVSNKVGIVDVLRGDVELSDALQDSGVPDFVVLPCGSRPKNPSELLSRPEYERLLQVLREKFDIVIIDTPPVLAVTDPCSVAPRVDGVIICMRLSRHTRELGRRTLDQLREVGAGLAGIVINGVEERDAYGYGSYRYSDYRYYYKNYNYKYRYGYGYGYGEKKLKDDYFSDDTEAAGSSNLLLANKKDQNLDQDA